MLAVHKDFHSLIVFFFTRSFRKMNWIHKPRNYCVLNYRNTYVPRRFTRMSALCWPNSLSYSFHWSHNADASLHNIHKPTCFVVTDSGHFPTPAVMPIEWLFIWGLWFVLWYPCCVGWGAHGVDCRMLLGRFIPIPLDAVYIAWADYQPHPTPRRLRQDVASKTLGKVLGTCLNPFHLTLVTPTPSV